MTRPAGSLRVSIFTRIRDPSLPRPKRKRAPARPRAAVVASLRDAPVYALRRPDGTDLVVSRGLLGCLYDLSVTQLCAAMRISLTTAKKIRAWSGLPCWPRVAILAGRCPGLSAPGIACGRLQMMTCARENDDMAAYEVLVRAHLSLCPDAFDPIPARLLDRLDDLLEDFD